MNPINEFILHEDILVFVELASDFGQDIAQSFVRLAEKLDHKGESRDCYGLVMKNNLNEMQYLGAFTQAYPEEAIQKKIDTFIIPKGTYYSILIENWNQKILEIGPSFDQILKSGLVNTLSPCIEFYQSEENLICMVKGK